MCPRPVFPIRLARALLVALPLIPLTDAAALTTHLSGNARAGGLPAVFQNFENLPTATLSGLEQTDSGNHAVTTGTLNTPGGAYVLASQASSGFVGSGSGTANGWSDITYVVSSATLPPGAPVQLDIRWAVAGRMSVSGIRLANVQDGTQATLNVRAAIFAGDTTLTNRTGSLAERLTTFDGFQELRSGPVTVEGDSQAFTVTSAVGQPIRIWMETTISAGTFAFAPAQCNADVQCSAVWGVSSLTPGVSVVLMENPLEEAPPATNATLPNAQQLLPPPPPSCTTITMQPQPRRACGGEAPFSVTAAGAGPLTYAWQIETCAGVWQTLGASPAPLPCGGTAFASPANSPDVQIGVHGCRGAFRVRCLVEQSCGSVASNAVTLTVCPADVNCDTAVSSQDFFDFLTGFFSGSADFNHDGATNSQDFFDFLAEFFVPC